MKPTLLDPNPKMTINSVTSHKNKCQICKGEFLPENLISTSQLTYCSTCAITIEFLMNLFNWNNSEITAMFLFLVRNFPTTISEDLVSFNKGVSIYLQVA